MIAPYGNGARAVQQSECCASKLNSFQVYCVIKDDTGFLWRGEKSNENEHKLGKQILDDFQIANKVDFDEGNEQDEFWAILGGKDEYTHVKDMMLADNDFEPMLFEISNKSGYMNMKQMPCFSQQSMLSDEVYILDNWNQMFVWVGTKSNKFEKSGAYRNADKYIAALHDGRKKEVIQIIEVEPTHEPPMFKTVFPNWSNQYAASLEVDQLALLKAQHAHKEAAAQKQHEET